MLPFAAAAACGINPAPDWVGGFFKTSGTSAALSTIKARAGDWAICGSPNAGSVTSGSGSSSTGSAGAGGWNYIGSTGAIYTFAKKLTEADIAAGVSMSGADFFLGVWRGATNEAAFIAHAGGTGSATTTDAVKGAGHLGLVALTFDYHTYSPVTVTDFTLRGSYTNTGGSGYRVALFDRVTPNGLFADHDPITLNEGFYALYLDIIELRRVG